MSTFRCNIHFPAIVLLAVVLGGCAGSSLQSTGSSQLVEAARNGDTARVRALLEQEVDPNTADKSGATPLWVAIENRHHETAELLVSRGARVDAAFDGFTPLAKAALDGNTKATNILLRSGADAEARNKYGATPLLIAAEHGRVGVARALLDHGVAIDADNDGATSLYMAVQSECAPVIELLVARGADRGSQARNGVQSPSGCHPARRTP